MPETRRSSRHPSDMDSEKGRKSPRWAKPSTPRKHKAQGSSDDSDDLEDNLRQVQSGVQQLKRKIEKLRRDKAALQASLDSAQARYSQGGSMRRQVDSETDDDMTLSAIRIKSLEKLNKDLQAENRKQSRRITKLKAKHLEEEVKDLQLPSVTGDGEEEIDPLYRMRKLLRRFSDLMMAPTIPADTSEECPVCFERFILKKCSALACGHLICHECLPGISKGADETVKCPHCREICSRDELSFVHMDEEARWDRLLEVAQAWDAYDQRGEMESSEEEAEENFLTDGNGTSDYTSEGGVETNQAVTEDTSSEGGQLLADEEQASRQATPPPAETLSFFESPTKVKRKMLEQLAEQRAHKKRR